ncbi:thioredoxin-like domain-containing protein [Puia sp. P3]|uniref:thioredoxin-like domain-containing protein n=1 Tax=Puia sp. P3 TaxID=3423952 RepID=UPI003D679ADC
MSAYLLSRQLGQLSIEEKEKDLQYPAAIGEGQRSGETDRGQHPDQQPHRHWEDGDGFYAERYPRQAGFAEELQGKYVLVDFWASWCVPCRGENPNVVAAFNKYKDRNFTVLGVSLDQPTGKEKWLKAIHDDRLTWTHVSDLKFWNNAVARQYDINSIPANLLLDPEGKIVAKDLHGEELEKKLSEVLTQRGFSLSGQVSGGRAPARINFYYTDDKGANVHDSARVVGGKFSCRGSISVPTMAYITGASTSRDEAHSVTVFLEPSAMTIVLPAADYRKAVVSRVRRRRKNTKSWKSRNSRSRKKWSRCRRPMRSAGAAMNAAVRAGKPQDLIDHAALAGPRRYTTSSSPISRGWRRQTMISSRVIPSPMSPLSSCGSIRVPCRWIR